LFHARNLHLFLLSPPARSSSLQSRIRPHVSLLMIDINAAHASLLSILSPCGEIVHRCGSPRCVRTRGGSTSPDLWGAARTPEVDLVKDSAQQRHETSCWRGRAHDCRHRCTQWEGRVGGAVGVNAPRPCLDFI
jgi:hypothetical protein